MSDGKRRDEYDIELGEKNNKDFDAPPSPPQTRFIPAPSTSLSNNPVVPIISYCASSILMTVTNKYVLSGTDYNLNFFLLCVQVCVEPLLASGDANLVHPQSIVCVVAIQTCKSSGIITYRDFKADEAKKCMSRNTCEPNHERADPIFLGFPISLLLIGMIYTSTKALRFLSIPVYTIFKNLTIILIAYGEVLWFGGSVTSMALFSFGLMVLSSVIAAWADIKHALESHGTSTSEATARISTLNAGYIWMLANCLCTAAYVLGMRKRIKLTNFKDFDSKLLLPVF
jgi:GDP-mannose transporter